MPRGILHFTSFRVSSVGSEEKKSRIPVGTQFSPDLIDFREFLRAAISHKGTKASLQEAVTVAPVRTKSYAKPPTRRMKGLPLEAAVQYGLLTPSTYTATSLAQRLATLPEQEMFEEFARHILTKLGGLRVVLAAEEMFLDGRDVNGDSLAQYLTEQGFRVSVHNTAINTLRMWLAKAGLFPPQGRGADAWRPDPTVKAKLVGMDDSMIAALLGLTEEQRVFAITLARMGATPGVELPASGVRDTAETYGIRIGRGSLPNEVLTPLKAAELIDFRTKGTEGGKASILWVTEKFDAEVLKPFLEETIKDLDPVLAAYYRSRPADIKKDLESKNPDTRGRALEAYVVFLMRLLGLRFVGWRRRARDTGSGEVDVLMTGLLGALPTTWQVQCKNTPSSPVRLEDVAREVGLLPLTRATHILMVANSPFTKDARKFAEATVQNSPVTVFLLDGEDFQAVLEHPESLGPIIRSQAEVVQRAKAQAPVWMGIAPGTSNGPTYPLE